jgi:signal transduction histidine kinase
VKIWRGLGKRILLGSILCGLIGLFVSQALMRRTARDAILAGVVPYVRNLLESGELARCEANPAHWSIRLRQGVRVDAYDEATLTSANPDAPSLDRGLYERLTNGEPSPLRLARPPGEHAGVMMLRTADSGPCSLVQVTWPPRPLAGRRFWYILLVGAVVVMALATGLGFVAVVRPLTSRIERLRTAAGNVGAQDGFVSARDERKDELGELSSMLDGAHERIRRDAGQLQDRQRALERYLSDVAHDLRTPIASLQIALEQAGQLAKDEDTKTLMKSALKDVVYLAGLTDNLRLACRLRDGWDPAAGNPSVDLTDTVLRVARRADLFAKNRGISFESSRPDGPLVVRCDAIAAEQAITNLVENAIAYGDPGGHVALLLETNGTAGFRLVVIDDGPGVLPVELPRLGERTFRSDEARQRDPSGSGLGLAITSEICSRCSFRLAFAREEPRGLRVTIDGPALRPAARA